MNKTSTPAVIRRFALPVCIAALALVAVVAPTTASACGPYGPSLSAAQWDVVQVALDATAAQQERVVEYTAVVVDQTAASIWVKAQATDGDGEAQWRKLALIKQGDTWSVNPPASDGCRT